MDILPVQFYTVLLNPILILIFLIRKLPLGWFFTSRMYIDGIDRPYYAFGLYRAALEAKALGIRRISAYEFGVAGGRGLIILEKLSEQISKVTGVTIDIYGFDLLIDLPQPSGYKDVPYLWQKGFYKMDIPALRKKIKKSTTLVLGNVKKTVPKFVKRNFSPIGFIAFDLDYYTSTHDAFKLFDAADRKMLPRVFCYFDEVIGLEEDIMCDYVGELLAIKEFNDVHKTKKLAKINGLFHKRPLMSAWSDMIYVMHNFKHKLYNKYIYPAEDRQIILPNKFQP